MLFSKSKLSVLVCLLVLQAPLFAQDGAESADAIAIDVPYQKFVLANGLTLVVHEDHKAPIVAVNVWYHVGSKNEKFGKTGFAHLFEHLLLDERCDPHIPAENELEDGGIVLR